MNGPCASPVTSSRRAYGYPPTNTAVFMISSFPKRRGVGKDSHTFAAKRRSMAGLPLALIMVFGSAYSDPTTPESFSQMSLPGFVGPQDFPT